MTTTNRTTTTNGITTTNRMTKTNRNDYQRRNAKSIAARVSRANPGVEKLSKAADQKVQEKSEKIATALADQAINGNASAARLLVDLAEGADWVQNHETVQQVLGVVQRLLKEPRLEEAPVEMPAGVLAPEGALVSSGEGNRIIYLN